MNFNFLHHRRLRWINLPGAILMLLLQRTPALSLLGTTEEIVIASPMGTVLKSIAASIAALGAVNTLVGATPLVPSTGTASGITVAAGSSVNVFYTVNGTQTPPMSWHITGTVPAGLNFSGLTNTGSVNVGSLNLTGTPTTAGVYPVTLQTFEFTNTGGIGSPVYNYTITVTGSAANSAPVFTTQPTSKTVTAGQSASFTAAASGTPAPTFQWQKGNVAINGATSSSFSIANVAAGDAGDYTVVATNSAGSATSNVATLTVGTAATAPAFTTQPVNQTATVGGAVTFTSVATGSPAPTYQWKKGGANINGATASDFTIANVASADAGNYTVTATNSAGSVTSNSASLTVSTAPAAPTFTTQPASQVANAGGSATFTAVATGTPTPTYQWQKDGVNLAGATSASLTIASLIPTDAGNYAVVASNSQGSVTSATAALTVGVAASHQLTNSTVTSGHMVSFSAGNTPGALQWQVSSNNGSSWSNLTNDSTYSGTTTSTLLITNAPASLNGLQYRYVATNAGVVATSNGATLTVAQAFFPFPSSVAVDNTGNLYVGDSNSNVIQKITTAGQVSLIAGQSGTAGSADGNGASARFNMPAGIAINSTGIIFVADTANATIRRIGTDGAVTTFAGTASVRGSADGAGTAATFSMPNGIALDAAGNLYVADSMNDTIRKITATGTVTTFAGTAGALGSTNGNGAAARFNLPTGLTIDSTGNLYVSDTTNNLIRKITATGDVTTFAGLDGVSGSQDGTGGAAFFNHPNGLTIDGAGNLYVADTGNSVIRKITPAGNVTTLAGLAGIAGLLDGSGSDAFFNQPQALGIDAGGNLYVADTGNAALRKINTAGGVTTLTLSAAPVSTPNPTPTPTPTPTPAPMPSGGGGGGGALSDWFIGLLAILCAVRWPSKKS